MSKERRQAPGNGDRRSIKSGDRAAWHAFELTGKSEPPSDIWAAGLLRWWDTAPGPTSAEAQKFFRQVVELGRPYFSLAERVAGNAQDQNSASLDRWLDELRREYAAFAERATARAEQAVRDLFAFWESSLEQWRRGASVGMEQGGPQAPTSTMQHSIDPFALPAFGYTREWQERYQRLGRAARDYIDRLRDYNGSFVRVASDAVEKLRATIGNEAGQVTEVRSLYNLWVHACEAAYAEYFMSPVYAERYGRAVNALAMLRREVSSLADDVLQAVNLPTRRDIDDLARRMHDTRRELARLRAAVAQAEMSRRHLGRHGPVQARPRKPQT